MKRLFFIIVMILTVSAVSVNAQPQSRRQAQKQKQEQSNANNVSVRSQISYPAAQAMSQDVVWRRDLYREIVLDSIPNSPLYYPEEPRDGQVNLFTYIFKLMLSGKVKVYEYTLDGNENFSDSTRLKPLDLLNKYDIYYTQNGKSIHIEPSDIPSHDVKSYFLKESAYYDQGSSTFHRKVIALCPVMKRDDGFGDATPYPLFWVKYDDLAPFLAKQTLMTSDYNNAATMSADDYFTKNMYQGKIYKTNNMLGKTLIQLAGGDENKLKAEQQKIENEIAQFEKGLYGTDKPKAPEDSTAVDNSKSSKKSKTTKSKTTKTTKAKKTREPKSSSSSSGARVSARRQRH